MESEVQKQTERARVRSQFRSVVGTTFFLVLLLALASAIHIVKPPLTYFLFCLIFVVDFSLQAYIIWKYKIYWISNKRIIKGKKARVVAIVFGLLVIVCLLFAIFSVAR
ncbi:MAG: hypothetical protein COT25_00095 [Candidatus Kerfeldbacteria bacterium CG08_land_8_20_14_0_20_42_7]|uniref:Uncharacterized protein n=1 Tax=Candidatus Kerfeldbacteria bacterium CG08_land_8_20_14_0_20_42_7 TaxID=2014245 RepID=A0A2H0YU28_9BACT|nr:MAG: hypothetical protein COT25_00095 [Candidatus Kerfeldbacteria bacterium CG08_land_8_20_14_0_20_42_7]